MEEMIKEEALEQPNSECQTFSQELKATTPDAPNNNAFVEVKFNKETKKLTLEEAATLAQKGMKLDRISEEIKILQELSKEKGVGLSEFVKGLKTAREGSRIEEIKARYSEDAELCEVLSRLEKEKSDGMDEIKALCPDMCEETLPQEVKTAAEKSGKGLVFEYLLYEYRKNLAEKQEAARQESSREASLGSVSSGSTDNTADAEFIRGLWG